MARITMKTWEIEINPSFKVVCDGIAIKNLKFRQGKWRLFANYYNFEAWLLNLPQDILKTEEVHSINELLHMTQEFQEKTVPILMKTFEGKSS